ncbi:MAG: hypothetical protein EOP21_12240, partial [Hyphomicrobiales bacterium]
RRRLTSGQQPPDRPRRVIEAKEQPHRPDLPQPALPYVVGGLASRPKRPRDILNLGSPDFVRDSPARQIMRECCDKHEITMSEMVGPHRFAIIVRARQEAAYRMLHETKLSLTQIGKKLGDRDHTTILHSVRAHEARITGGVYNKSRGSKSTNG